MEIRLRYAEDKAEIRSERLIVNESQYCILVYLIFDIIC